MWENLGHTCTESVNESALLLSFQESNILKITETKPAVEEEKMAPTRTVEYLGKQLTQQDIEDLV